MSESFCNRCNVFGHEQGSAECNTYYIKVEKPFYDWKQSQIGKVRRLTEDTQMWPVDFVYTLSPSDTFFSAGTAVRITNWTPWTSFRAGDYWSICTLDGKYSATQIYTDELGELPVLDRLALIKEEENQNEERFWKNRSKRP